MVDIWDSIKETAKSFGGVAIAPQMAILDLASMPFDDKDDDFGTVLNAAAKRGGQALDPVLNPETMTGATFSKAMEGLHWATVEGVSRPTSTLFTMASAADATGNPDPHPFWLHHSNILNGLSGAGVFFDGGAWAEAYEKSGQYGGHKAFASALLDDGTTNPFDYENPYDEVTKKDHPILAPAAAYSGAAVALWWLDPAVVAGKSAGLLRQYGQLGKLGEAERGKLHTLLTNESPARFRNHKTRTDNYLDWIGGKNSLGRPLNAAEIKFGSKELKEYATDPDAIAGLLAEAGKIDNPALVRNAQRRILAVAGGDTGQITRLETEIEEAAHIADSLRNMAKGSTIDLKLLGADPNIRHNPTFIAHLEHQLGNQNLLAREVEKFMGHWQTRLNQMLDTADTMPNLPGVHAAGRRGVKRQHETGALRAGDNVHRKADDWADSYWAQAQSASSLWQKGKYAVPVLAVRTAGMAASPWTKFPVKVSDSLRQSHFTGQANLHDWGSATNQLDSMMRTAQVPAGERLKTLSELFLAKSEPEKLRLIDRVENLSVKSVAAEFSAKYGREIDKGYITELMLGHAQRRNQSLSSMRGRAYSATKFTDEMMATRGPGMRGAEDSARAAEGRANQSFSAPAEAGEWRPRVDQILEDGTPVSLPVLDTQLANTVPLLDINLARKVMDRDHSHLTRLSRAWGDEALEVGRLVEMKRAGAQGIDRALEARRAAMDWLVDAGQTAMRYWKFGVLFRLGYPIRVLMDDHWRIWTQINAATFYGDNGKEYLAHWRHNHLTRRDAGKEMLAIHKARRAEILDLLEGDRVAAHGERLVDLKRHSRRAGAQKGLETKLRSRIATAESRRGEGLDHEDVGALQVKLEAAGAERTNHEAAQEYLREQLGETDPAALRRELVELEETIRGGAKPLRPEKRRVGDADVELPGGLRVPGSMAGVEGQVYREASTSHGTFQTQLQGVEERTYKRGMEGSHRTIQPDEAGHVDAWADVLNYQFRNSPVAMHFIKGGTVDDFVRWVKAPEQSALRERVSHYAHDPEDWGHRVQAMVHDYIPSGELAEQLAKGKVSTKALAKQFQDPALRPAVHGRVAADNLGTSERSLGISNAMNRAYRWIGELPTDNLARHPFFNSMYKKHVNDLYERKRIGYADEGRKFTQADVDDLASKARKLALADVKRTLFDISAHSDAAHAMRFVSPFFAAHQEVISRWWKIVGNNPHIVRRFQQAFDVPRHFELTVNEDGDLVKPGEPISTDHRILLQLPRALGGADPETFQSKWTLGENSFNVVLQGGLTNPGVGPIVSAPLEYFAKKYADQSEMTRVARILNPFPANSPLEVAVPATVKRGLGVAYAEDWWRAGNGIGAREYNRAFAGNVQDLTTDFMVENGREPNRSESQEILLRAGRESNVDAWLRLMWNSTSPAPASPKSRYSVIQHSWRQIQEQAQAEGREYEWAYGQFKEKWGEAYMALIYSSANNPAHLSANAATVGALKRYRGVLDRIDPSLTRMVVGPYADELDGEGEQEFSVDAQSYLRTKQMKPGSKDPYYSYDDPAQAMEEQMARRGWQKYGELTGALTAMAQEQGLNGYQDSDKLMELKKVALARLREDNWAFNKEFGSFDTTKFDRHLDDMRTIVKSPALAKDTARPDVQVLGSYLNLRDYFVKILDARKAAGFGGPTAQANEKVLAIYTALVGRLVESNTYFETHMYNGLIEKDPLLAGEEG